MMAVPIKLSGDGFKPGELVYIIGNSRQPGKSEMQASWLDAFNNDIILRYELKIEYRKTYNGYTIGFYTGENRRKDAFCDTTRSLMKMTKEEFIEHIKKEFNAIPKNHYSVFFRTEEDAQKAVDWIDAMRLAKKWEAEKIG